MTVEIGVAQQPVQLHVQVLDSFADKDNLDEMYEKGHNDSLAGLKGLNQFMLNLYKIGYLTATVDCLIYDSIRGYDAFVKTGEVIRWIYLRQGNLETGFWNKLDYVKRSIDGKPYSLGQVIKLTEVILGYYENNGFPFVSVRLDSFEFVNNRIAASIVLDRNLKINIDTLKVHSDSRINNKFLYNYLGIRPGDIYDHSIVSSISKKIRELPFLLESKLFEIDFVDDEVEINLFLKSRKSSKLSGIIGILPNTETDKGILVTGDLNLFLQNSMGYGEKLDFSWKRYKPLSPELKFRFLFPYLLNLPFELGGHLYLLKQDTSYIDLDREGSVGYSFSPSRTIRFFVKSRKTNTLGESQPSVSVSENPIGDVAISSYGSGLHLENLDYRINPRKGYSVNMDVAIGSRVISNVQEANDDDVSLKSTQYDIRSQLGCYVPIRKRSVLHVGFQGAAILGTEYFENELFRIGGLQSIRGFDEESILASSYAIVNIEYRYLLERNSNLYVFWNGSYYEKNTYINHEIDRPYGFGVGMSFETKPGIFSLSYALGSHHGNPVDVRASKVHFGILNYF